MSRASSAPTPDRSSDDMEHQDVMGGGKLGGGYLPPRRRFQTIEPGGGESKGAVIAMTRALAREPGGDSITVNALAPGFTLTETRFGVMENAATYGVDRGAVRRAGLPDDITGAAVFLATPSASFVTGQTLIIDGGRLFL